MLSRSRSDDSLRSHETLSSQYSSECPAIDDIERLAPVWCKYRALLYSRGYCLDTCRDVKNYYNRYWDQLGLPECDSRRQSPEFSSACVGRDDDALCRDPGLPDNLFRGTQRQDRSQVVIKAVKLHGREFDVIRFLSTRPIRDEPLNHCIPVLDLIEEPDDGVGFIVMEEWSRQVPSNVINCLRLFLSSIRQCIEHISFMHKHRIAYLDISIHNILTDCHGQFAFIDYETSRRYDGTEDPKIYGQRTTEVPPELELFGWGDPFKVDVWALAVLILRACKAAGYEVPELMRLVKPMLEEDPNKRPPASEVLNMFHRYVSSIPEARLGS